MVSGGPVLQCQGLVALACKPAKQLNAGAAAPRGVLFEYDACRWRRFLCLWWWEKGLGVRGYALREITGNAKLREGCRQSIFSMGCVMGVLCRWKP